MPSEPHASPSTASTGGNFPPPTPALPSKQPQGEWDLVEPVILTEEASIPRPTASRPAKPQPNPTRTAPAQKPPQLAALPVRVHRNGENDPKATMREGLRDFGMSLALHAAVLLMLWFMVIPRTTREELLSVLIDDEAETLTDPPPPADHIIQNPEIIDERAVEHGKHDFNALVLNETNGKDLFNLKINDASLTLKPNAIAGPSLPGKTGDHFAGRSEAARSTMLAERGGNAASDAAVAGALAWLASIQRRDGSWDFNDVGEAGDPGRISSPTGATGLALMAFLGAGHTHAKECKYQHTVRRGIEYLLKAGVKVRPVGMDFRGQSPGIEGMYVQAIVVTALAEAYGMTEDEQIKPVVQEAVNFIVRAQHSEGGWRYAPNTPGDTSVVGWQVMALKSAYRSNIAFPRTVFSKVKRFLAGVSHADGSQYSYMPGEGPKPSTTAIGLLCRMYLGWKHDTAALEKGVNYLARTGPLKDDIYHDYYASQVMIQFTGAKGDLWDKWNTDLRDWLVATQLTEGPGKGSWDVIETNHKGERGGRLYTTCLAVMTLEIYYRVLPLYQDAALKGEF